MTKNVELVLQTAGIRLEDATDELVALAEECLARHRYYDQAANLLLKKLGCREIS
jgi:hypothetical protein